MTYQQQLDAAEALRDSAAAMASFINSAAHYLKYLKIDIENYTNANYHQKM